MKSTLLFLGALVLLGGCSNEKEYFHENQSLSADLQWNKNDPKTFKVNITNNAQPLEVDLHFRYATGYAYDKLLMRMTEIEPDGERILHDLEIPIRDAKGEFIGEKGYDIVDLDYVLYREHEFPIHGEYTYIFEQAMPEIDPLHYALELGMTVKEKTSE